MKKKTIRINNNKLISEMCIFKLCEELLCNDHIIVHAHIPLQGWPWKKNMWGYIFPKYMEVDLMKFNVLIGKSIYFL